MTIRLCGIIQPVLVAGLLGAAPLFGSTVLYDNTASSWTSNMSVSSYFYQAQSFRTGSDAAYLDAVYLGLIANDGTDAPFYVQLYDGLYNGLGAPVATLTGPTRPGTGLIRYTVDFSTLLEADTTYWILARAYGATALGSPYGWTIAEQEPTIGTDSGRNMYYADTVHQWVGPTGPGDFIMKIEVVPEPTTSILMAMGCGLALGGRRRRAPSTRH